MIDRSSAAADPLITKFCSAKASPDSSVQTRIQTDFFNEENFEIVTFG